MAKSTVDRHRARAYASLVHKFKFKHEGRSYTLRTRSPDRDAPWYLVGVIAGQRMQRSLGTNVAEQARLNAISGIIKPALAGRWGRVKESQAKKPFATVGEVLDVWRVLVAKNNETHRTAAANALLNLLRRAGVSNPEGAGTEILNGKLARQFFDETERRCVGLDQIAAGRARRTANSLFNQARSVFKAAALARYPDHGLTLPDLREFLAAGKAERFTKGAEAEHEPPSSVLVASVLASWPKVEDWNTFAAAGLSLAFGLRAGEVAQARWDWFKVEDGLWVLDAKANVKRGTGTLRVTAVDPFWTTFRARSLESGRWGGTETVLDGTPTARRDGAARAVGKWLRALGWDLQKTTHGLRSYVGAQVSIRYGMNAAQLFLRHTTIGNTQKHYTGRWVDAAALRRGSVVEWAKASES